MKKLVPALLLALAFLGMTVPARADDIGCSSGSFWSETDASNNQASPNGWTSGSMTPNQVEPVARMMMGATKRFWDRANPTLSSTGTAPHYVVTPANVSFPTAYCQGEILCFKANFASAGGDDLNWNALGARPLYKQGGSGTAPIAANDIAASSDLCVAYDSALNSGGGGWQAVSPISGSGSGNVSGPASSTASDIPKFADTSGKALSDGYTVGTGANNVLQLTSTPSIPNAVSQQLQRQVFTSSGTFTTPAGTGIATRYKFTVVGGGGGAGNSASGSVGGGGGAADTEIYEASGVASGTGITITVGAGGAVQVAGNASSVVFNGVTVTAGGGQPGVSGAANSPGGDGGTGSGGDIHIPGGAGTGGSSQAIGGTGGASFMGGGTAGKVAANFTGQGAPGSGGGGTSNGFTASPGANGVVIVEWMQ
jgi:hypothetical protein